MKTKVSKHKLNNHYRGSPGGSRTQQHAYYLRYAHSQHIESHLGKKQPRVKIPIAFLFSQLHFNNVTSHALFYGGHLVMRSKRCAVQHQGITLKMKCPAFIRNTSFTENWKRRLKKWVFVLSVRILVPSEYWATYCIVLQTVLENVSALKILTKTIKIVIFALRCWQHSKQTVVQLLTVYGHRKITKSRHIS